MPRPRTLAAALAAAALLAPAAATAEPPPRTPCTIVPLVTTTRLTVTTWHSLTGGPWVAEPGVDSVTIACRVYVTGAIPDGPIGEGSLTTPGVVGVMAGAPVPAPAGADLTVCTTVTYEYFWPFFWEYLAYDACYVVPA